MTCNRLANLYDQHLHSTHSFDSQAHPEDNVRQAIEVGLAGLTFTEHYDSHPTEIEQCVYDERSYAATIRGLRDKYGDTMFIGKGIEVDFQPQNMRAIVDLLHANPFDLVVLSVHWCEGQPIHLPEVWKQGDAGVLTRRYLQSVVEAVRFCGELHQRVGRRVFDVLGHLDFVKRYSHRHHQSVYVEQNLDVIDDICRACMAADIVPEINTSTIRSGLGEPMPGLPVLERYVVAGGTMISLGSDSHVPVHIAADFDQALDLAHRAGIRQIALFDDRHRRLVPIP